MRISDWSSDVCSSDLFAEIVRLVDGRKQVNASLSTAFGCPFEGDVPDAVLLALVERIAGLGIARVTLCDPTGMAHPGQVGRLCRAIGRASCRERGSQYV